MFLHSQVSISGFLQETGLLKFLDSVGVEVLKGSIKETDFGGGMTRQVHIRLYLLKLFQVST